MAIFVISGKALERIEKAKTPDDAPKKTYKNLVFINPKILKSSKDKQFLEEGCLSVRYAYGQVQRPEKIIVEALDENGKKFSRGFSGFLAQIVQHENDHLNGILFIDIATDIKEISKEQYEKNLAELDN